MRLDVLFDKVPTLDRAHWDPHRRINKITSDSRSVETGDVFVACHGSRMDGHDFLQQSIYAGASVIVFEKKPDFPIPNHVMAIHVAHSRDCLSHLWKRFYNSPDQKVKLVGVTGTNGKTTIAYLLHRLVREKFKAAYIGTLSYELPGHKLQAVNTTPPPEILFPLLNEMAHTNTRYCFMEVSSHALDQRRVFDLQYELGIFTQLTQDHLDYHKTLERYYQSKRLLFAAEPQPKHMLINRDCPYGRRLLDEFLDARCFGIENPGYYQVSELDCSMQGSQFVFKYGARKMPFKIRLPMHHNISNVAAVLGALDLLGFELEEFRGLLQEFPGVPGRLERIPSGEDCEIFVDYAHTPDALEHVLGEARRLSPKRILTLFGCGGDRDRAKRPLMTAAAIRHSDIVIMTSDNPRSEDPEAILADMRKGIPEGGIEKPLILEILDRREAIDKLLSLSGSGDAVFVLGKGHEDYQILGDVKVPFDDRDVIRECLRRKSRVFFS
ncbi:MAG: UDP-N-acetylmuramoyl-L-alanyl-D-glutamate--2,6-diaminopimelate ligase [Candidatus Omnitrophica bacterium]|nr:UDP-N-acetylmuramoyl-L-alanyl-D-glutamate--2,6-diaminopimelate ligase [Candidatus Omnitrophota bacterium]MDD5670431.1 UDP-N-acetylmuramoyl-L-alanyl-D-glutamate--2,6-diaminopimelate ligase [Candidatus Omnitrophota bacterium]